MVESIATVPNIFVPQSSSDIPTCSNTLPRSKRKEEYNTELSINSYFTSRSRKNTSSVLLIALIYSFMFYVIMGYPLEQSRPDLICNDGTPYECVCNRSMGNLDNLYRPCEDFIDTQTLKVISIVMKKVNLEAKLHTNESYQQYFRRRIANIVSRYCEQQANECPGVIIPQISEETAETNVPFSTKFLLDEEEPLFDEDNVIILQVNFLMREKTELFFVVTKNENGIGKLNQDVIMDPDPIKYILTAQMAPLSRVLGGIRIERLKTVELTKQHVLLADNRKLYLLLTIIFLAIFLCYIVACIKVVRDCMARKRRKRNAGLSKNTTNNYGSCTEKLLPKFDTPNGKHKSSKSITSRESLSFKKKKVSTTGASPNEPQTPIMTLPDGEDSGSEGCKTIDARSFARMFAFDPSSLPPEIDVYEDEEQAHEASRPHSTTSMQLNNNEEIENTLPSVILAPSMSQNEKLVNDLKQFGTFLAANEYSPFERPTSRIGNRKDIDFARPLSRRGSRSSTPEQGVEETDTREDTPLPLGDDQVQETINAVLPVPDIIVRSNTAHKFDHWSSDSEPEQIEVYQPLDEVSDEEKDIPEKTNIEDKNKNIKLMDKSSKNPTNSESEESANSDEEQDEATMLDRHQYERLQESPIPQTTFNHDDQSTIDIDSTLLYE